MSTSTQKLTLALLFGGSSSEHEISCISASSFAKHIDKSRYEILQIGITKSGNWLLTKASSEQIANGLWETLSSNKPCIISPSHADRGAIIFEENNIKKIKIDVAIPVLHGRFGEDGTLQGLFELANIPYVGCGVLASATCMDKAVTNALFEANSVPHCKWLSASDFELANNKDEVFAKLENYIGYPIFVKPANAGSSVGVSKATDKPTLEKAIKIALAEDNKIVFEEAINGQEVECAVLGANPPFVSVAGEIIAGDSFYTYDDKYKNGVSQTLIPAKLSEQKQAEVMKLAAKAYTALCCEGLSRCDFFVENETGRVLINEINTLPGFTAISMYPKLMEQSGYNMQKLIEKLISLALEKGGVC